MYYILKNSKKTKRNMIEKNDGTQKDISVDSIW